MKYAVLLNTIGLGICLLVSGCATMVGDMAGAAYLRTQQERMAKFPKASVGFQPKKIYDTTYEKIWKNVSHVLETNTLNITLIDKDNGRIVTDYVQGETQSMGPAGILGTITRRYKYNLAFEEIDQTKTRLGISCKFESRSLARQTAEWRDVSYENKQLITMLENWLYEQVEKGL